MPNENETPTRIEQYLAKAAGEDADLPSVPMTRIEQYLAKIAGEDVELPEETYTRIEEYLATIAENGGGGGDITLDTLTVSQNGTTNAPSGTAYNKVVASVPNSYSAGDEGKVVDNGALVAQTAHATVTSNGTYDTTLNDSVEVDVFTPTLESKSISANGTYTPAVGKAWNSVEVNVQGDTQADLIAANNNTLTSFSNSQITNVRSYMFKGCSNLASINLPNVEELYEGCFYGVGLTGNITFEKYIKTAQNLVFRACTMTTITFKNGLFRIDQSAFEGCTNLTTIDIGNQAVNPLNINGSRFYNTPNLSAMVLRYSSGVFPLDSSFPNSCNLYSAGYIYVPENLVDSYKSASNWSAYASRIVKIEGTQYETHYANGEAIS